MPVAAPTAAYMTPLLLFPLGTVLAVEYSLGLAVSCLMRLLCWTMDRQGLADVCASILKMLNAFILTGSLGGL